MNKTVWCRSLIATLPTAVLASAWMAAPARAEVSEVAISKGYGILYLPLIVMEDQKLLEKQAEKAGLGKVAVKWRVLDGGNVINDAMMAGSLDFAGTGAPAFVALWSKARAIPKSAVIGISALSATSLYLNSNNPQIKNLADFKSGDKIALPGIKTSLSAVVLQMMAAKQFGIENYAKLDHLTVGLPHPDGLIALTSGRSTVSAPAARSCSSIVMAATLERHVARGRPPTAAVIFTRSTWPFGHRSITSADAPHCRD